MDNDIIAALPVSGEPDADLLRAFLVQRVIHVLQPDENPSAFVALVNSAVPQGLAWQEKIYWLDPDDTTSAPDAVTIRTSDNYVYKAALQCLKIRSVLSRSITEQPETGVEAGDAFLVPPGAEGDDWADYANYIALYSLRGWLFVMPRAGDWLYVEDEDVYVRFSAAGAWEIGPGNRTFGANAIPLSALINCGRFVIVENQTTNAPPGSPNAGVAYIIGNSPTGDWSGHAGKVAICEIDDVWTIYAPPQGMLAYDKAQNRNYQYNGSSWQTASGRTRTKITTFTASGTYTKEARCVEVVVKLVAAGANATTVSNGGSVSFGAHLSASGGIGGSPHTGGSGSGGDENFTGQTGSSTGSYYRTMSDAGFGMHGSGNQTDGGAGFGGAGGSAKKRIPAASLLTNETVTFSAGGMNNGFVEVVETIED